VFGCFYQGDEASRDITTGSGLGLSIVKAIVDHYEGAFEVESQPVTGLKFKWR